LKILSKLTLLVCLFWGIHLRFRGGNVFCVLFSLFQTLSWAERSKIVARARKSRAQSRIVGRCETITRPIPLSSLSFSTPRVPSSRPKELRTSKRLCSIRPRGKPVNFVLFRGLSITFFLMLFHWFGRQCRLIEADKPSTCLWLRSLQRGTFILHDRPVSYSSPAVRIRKWSIAGNTVKGQTVRYLPIQFNSNLFIIL